jgi:putative peptidoglycan lipid II flippase
MDFNHKHAIGKSAVIVGSFGLIADIAALLRDRLFAAQFGAGHILDSYYAAFRIPDLVYNLLILGTLSVAFIPVFTEHLVKDEDEAERVGNTILTAAVLLVSVICGVLYFFVPWLTRTLIAPGFSGQTYDNAVVLTKIFLLSPIIFTASSVFGSVLNSLNRFLMVSIAPVLYNLGIMFGIVFLYPRFGIRGLGYGVILGALLHLLTQIIGAAIAGFKYKPWFDLRHPGVRKIFKLLLPRIISIDNAQISLWIASFVGSFLAAGSIVEFNFAENLQMVPIGIFALSFAAAAFPNLSEQASRRQPKEFAETLFRTMVNVLYFIIPSAILFIVLRAQIVRVIYGTGSFNWTATELTANALGIFAISMAFQSVTPLFARAFYARQNTIIPMIASLGSAVINIGASVFLGRMFGVLGLSAGFCIASIVNAVILFVLLMPKIENGEFIKAWSEVIKILISSLALGIVTYFSLYFVQIFLPLDKTINVLTQGLLAGILGMLVYFGITKMLGMAQSNLAIQIIKRRFIR